MVNTISALAGVLLSLAITYIKPFKAWFDGLEYWPKRLVLALFLVIATALSIGLACLNVVEYVDAGFTCDTVGVTAAVSAFISALVANQAAYQIFGSPKPK